MHHALCALTSKLDKFGGYHCRLQHPIPPCFIEATVGIGYRSYTLQCIVNLFIILFIMRSESKIASKLTIVHRVVVVTFRTNIYPCQTAGPAINNNIKRDAESSIARMSTHELDTQ